MKKEGVSHIEMVLAFVLFISALLFIFNYVDITKSTKNHDSTLTYVSGVIKSNISVDLTVYTISFNELLLKDNQIVAIDLGNSSSKQGIRVENYSGTLLQYQRNHIVGEEQVIFVDRNNAELIRVSISEDISSQPASLPSTPNLNTSLYAISSVKTDSMFSEKRIISLKENYNSDYIGLKKRFSISPRTDFSFSTQFGEGDFINVERDIPQKSEVLADHRRYEILRVDGSTAFADFIIKLW